MTTSETKHRRRAGLTNAARRGLHAAREDTPDPDAVHGLPQTHNLLELARENRNTEQLRIPQSN